MSTIVKFLFLKFFYFTIIMFQDSLQQNKLNFLANQIKKLQEEMNSMMPQQQDELVRTRTNTVK